LKRKYRGDVDLKNVPIGKIFVLGALMISCFTAGVFASDGIKKVEAYLRPDFTIKVDGETVSLDKPPLIYNNSSYMPLRVMGQLIGADVVWQDDTKTIYINKRKSVEIPTDHETGEYNEIKLQNPSGLIVTYLGRDYPLLSNIYDYITYYRVSDLQRMGVDTNGLRKVKEKWTEALYVRKEEAEVAWKEAPVFRYPNGPLISGEYDPKKIETLRSFSPIPAGAVQNYPYLENHYGIIIAIEALSQENEYEALSYNYSGQYYKYQLKLSKHSEEKRVDGVTRTEVSWYVSSYSSEELH
jgi:hypothetical protein